MFTHKDIETRTIFVVNCIEHHRGVRVSNGELLLEEKDAEKKNAEMGRKCIVPYGLYRAEGYISANLARKVTGFSEDDLELFCGCRRM